MNDRDMFYSNYGYSSMPYMNPMLGMMPMQMNPMMNMMPTQDQNNSCNNNNSNNNDIDNRLSRVERQIRRLDQRVTRLENPYGSNNTTNIYNEPDSSMYMM